jgi:cobalamin biosynthesis protein CobD/CbiB
MFDQAISITDVTIITGVITGIWVVWQHFTSTLRGLTKERREQYDALKSELNEFKIHVAKEYASRDTIAAMEDRIHDAVAHLAARLDKIIDRLSGNRE